MENQICSNIGTDGNVNLWEEERVRISVQIVVPCCSCLDHSEHVSDDIIGALFFS